jgi:hypothetical protein
MAEPCSLPVFSHVMGRKERTNKGTCSTEAKSKRGGIPKSKGQKRMSTAAGYLSVMRTWNGSLVCVRKWSLLTSIFTGVMGCVSLMEVRVNGDSN